MDLLVDKVTNVDSDMMQGASVNKIVDENQTNTFGSSDKLLYKLENNEALSGSDKFRFDKSCQEEGSLPKSNDANTYSQNLEQLIQKSVSKSTARLLTKNTLKYLDKDLTVSPGKVVSKQFTVRSAKNGCKFKEASGSDEGYRLPLNTPGDKSVYESSRSIYIDPKISSFRLHKVTYEMYKLFENIRAFESSSREDRNLNRPAKEAEIESVVSEAVAQPSLRKLSIASSNIQQPYQNTSTLFESRLKPNPYPSLSTQYPEDSNNLTYTSTNRFGSVSYNFTPKLDGFESGVYNSSDFGPGVDHSFVDKLTESGCKMDISTENHASADYKSRDYTEPGYQGSEYDHDSRKIFSYPMVSKTLDYTTGYEGDGSKYSEYGAYVDDNYNRKSDSYGTENYKVDSFNESEFRTSGFSTNFESNYDSGDYDTFDYSQPDYSRDYEELNYKSSEYPMDHNGDADVYKIQLDFKEKMDVEPFATALSKTKEEVDSEGVKYTSFNNNASSPEFDNVGARNDKSSGTVGKNEKSTDGSKKTNRKDFNPSYVTKVYVPVGRMNFLPKRRAVVVGCNYLGNPNAHLRGSCNDAFAFAQVLVSKYNFDPSGVILLLDSRPSPAYTRYLSQFNQNNPFQPSQGGLDLNLDLSRVKSNVIERNVYPTKRTSMFGRHLVDRDLKHLSLSENLYVDAAVIPAPQEMQPSRANVFRSLKWLNFISSPNDFAVFYFSGQSVQVDDLSGYEGDGFDEALVPADYETNGLVTCNDLRCLFQSIGATCRLNVFLDTCNMQTVVGAYSRAGPIKGSKMKGFWPFSEPTGKLKEFKCGDWAEKDQKMIDQMARLKFIPTLQVDSLSSLSDVQLSLDATHGVVNYCVLTSSNLNGASLECLFKPFNLGQIYKDNDKTNLVSSWSFKSNVSKDEKSNMVKEDEVIVHGAFTYALILTLLYDKSSRRGGLGVDEVVEGVNKKLLQLKRMRLPRLNQQCEALFYHSSKLPKNAFLFPPSFSKFQKPKPTGSAYGFYLPEEAWMFMVDQGRERAREHQQKFERMKTDLITLSNLNNKFFNQSGGVSSLNTTRTEKAANDHKTNRTGTGAATDLQQNKLLGLLHTPGSVNASNADRRQQFNQYKCFPNTVEVPMKPVGNSHSKNAALTGRSLTNNVTARVFTRTSSIPGKLTSRSKTATFNNRVATNTSMTQGKPGLKAGKFAEVIPSHNWYGGCTVSGPFNTTTAEQNFYTQPTWYTNVSGDLNFNSNICNNQAYYDRLCYGKFGTMPLYEPITDAMLQNLPTRKSFNVLYQ